ncbi:MAG: hypothetical protein ACOYO1_09515 [Bacteroidales bacterium]
MKKDPKLKVFNALEPIQFGSTSLSITSNELFRTKGLPFCFNALIFGEYNITIIGYHETIQSTKLKSVYVFANDVFIMGEYAFTGIDKIGSQNILKTLIKKYISDSIENIDKFFIKDKNNNHIYFADNGFEISVKYFLLEDTKAKEIYSVFSNSVLKSDEINHDAINSKLTEMF